VGPVIAAAPHIIGSVEPPSASRSAILERVASEWLLQHRTALAPLDLTHAQARLLIATAWLGSRAGTACVRQSEIAAEAGTDPVMTSEVLRVLEARGLLTRSPHPTDRRARSIAVTDDGLRLADKASRLTGAVETQFFEAGMPAFGTLAKALKKGGRG
jgi:MarR family transcriptional regulator, organic hydroperoxide resistance regulator